jgi:hypothetical protein
MPNRKYKKFGVLSRRHRALNTIRGYSFACSGSVSRCATVGTAGGRPRGPGRFPRPTRRKRPVHPRIIRFHRDFPVTGELSGLTVARLLMVDVAVLAYRVLALAIVLSWLRMLVRSVPKPSDWVPPGFERLPVRMTRDRLIAASLLGIVAGLMVLAFSFTSVFPLTR